MNHWNFPYFELKYLQFIKKCLTDDWALIQGGHDEETLRLWQRIFETLEIDRKAMVDLMLLAHSGESGRAEANEILWWLLSHWALKPDYEDLSHKVTSEVTQARRKFDRPPANHRDLAWWRWSLYWEPRAPRWGPRAAPAPWARVRAGPGGEPVAPPDCWA